MRPAKYLITCKVCGRRALAKQHNKQYCDDPKCRKKAFRARHKDDRLKVTCAYCFETFEAKTSSARYCCDAHKQAMYRRRQKAGLQATF